MKILIYIVLCSFWMSGFAQKPAWQSVFVSQSEEGITHCNQVIKTQDGGFAITGFFDHHLKLTDTTIYTEGGQDGFVAKLDSNWQLDWIHTLSGPGDNAGLALVELTNGNIVAGGKFYDSVTVAGSKLNSRGGCDILLFGLEPFGNLLWVKSAGGEGDDYIGIGRLGYTSGGMAKGVNDNIYITGAFGGNNYSPPLQYNAIFDSTQITAVRGADVFLAKYSGNGKLDWIREAGGSYHDVGVGIYTKNKMVCITGVFQGPSINVGGIALPVKESSFDDMFVASYDTSGNFSWVKGAGNFNPVGGGASCILDSASSVYVTGSYFDDDLDFGTYILPSIGDFDMYVAKYDSTGNLKWARNGGGGSSDVGQCLAIDHNNKIYLSGFYGYDGIFGSDTVFGNRRDLFLTQIDENGNFQWIVTAEGSGDETPFDILVVDEGEIYVSGYFESSSVTFGAITVQNAGDRNFFIAKLGPDTSTGIAEKIGLVQVQVYPNPVSEGSEVTIAFAPRMFQSIAIHDLQGREVMRMKITPTVSHQLVDVSSWRKGIYFIRLRGEDGEVTKPLIKN